MGGEKVGIHHPRLHGHLVLLLLISMGCGYASRTGPGPAASVAVLPAPEMALTRAKKESHPPEMPAPQCWFGRFGSWRARSLAFLGSREKNTRAIDQ